MKHFKNKLRFSYKTKKNFNIEALKKLSVI